MGEDIIIIKNYLKCMEFSIKYQTYFEINYEQTKEFYNSIHKLLKEIEELHKEINQRIKLKIENEKCVDRDFIYKGKIREKLNYFEHSYDYDDNGESYELVMKVLQELLEEN